MYCLPPLSCHVRYVDAALYLTELQSDGVLGAVGVTNFDVPRMEAMVNKGAQIVSNQVGVWVCVGVPAKRSTAQHACCCCCCRSVVECKCS